MLTIDKKPELCQLIYRFTHQDSKGTDPQNPSIMYCGPNGGTTLGPVSQVPDITFAELHVYSLSKQLCELRDECLEFVLSKFNKQDMLNITEQWRDNLSEFAWLIDDPVIEQAIKDANIIFPDGCSNAYLTICWVNRNAKNGCLVLGREPYESGTSVQSIYEDLVAKLTAKIEQSRKVVKQLMH